MRILLLQLLIEPFDAIRRLEWTAPKGIDAHQLPYE